MDGGLICGKDVLSFFELRSFFTTRCKIDRECCFFSWRSLGTAAAFQRVLHVASTHSVHLLHDVTTGTNNSSPT